MKKAEINAILDKTNIKDLVYSQPGSAWRVRKLLSEELGEIKCPSERGIKTYIETHFNLVWDEEKDLWISSKEDTNPAKKSGKKRGRKPSKTLSIDNEIENKNNNNSTLGYENLSTNENFIDFNLSEKSNKESEQNSNLLESKNEEKIMPNSTEDKTTNSAKNGRKKGRKKSSETFVKSYEIEINDDDSIPNDEDLSISDKSTNSNPSEKPNEYSDKNSNQLESTNEEKNTSNSSTINQSKKIYNTGKSISSIENSSPNSKSKFKYKNIDPSQYAECIEYSGNEKYSLSLSPFVVGLVEEIILEKYNDKKLNKSKIVQLALMEFIRINTQDNNKDISH